MLNLTQYTCDRSHIYRKKSTQFLTVFREISEGSTEASIDFYNLKNNTDHENYKKILNSKLGGNFDFYPDSYNDLLKEPQFNVKKKSIKCFQ